MSQLLPLGEVSMTPPFTHRLTEPRGQIAPILARDGRVDTGGKAAKAHGPSGEARAVMGVFTGIGHDGPGIDGDDRLCHHAPAGVVDEGDAKGGKIGKSTRGFRLGHLRTPAGDDERDVRVPRLPSTERREGGKLGGRKMRIAERNQLHRT